MRCSAANLSVFAIALLPVPVKGLLYSSETPVNDSVLMQLAAGVSQTATDIDDSEEVTIDPDAIELLSSFNLKIFYTAVGVVGMVGNLFVFVVIVTDADMRKTLTNLFILNQSALDGISSLFVSLSGFFEDPLAIPEGLARDLYCSLWISRVLMWGFFNCSAFNLIALTFERYLALVHPLYHMTSFTRKKALVQVVAVWILGHVSFLLAGGSASQMQGDVCLVWSVYPNRTIHLMAVVFIFVTLYLLPAVLIMYAYVRIILVLRTQKVGDKKSSNQARDDVIARARQNVLKMLCIVFIFFLICWSPNLWVYLLRNINLIEIDYQGWFYHSTVVLAFVNCVINPFIYAIKYEEFRNVIKEKLYKSSFTCKI